MYKKYNIVRCYTIEGNYFSSENVTTFDFNNKFKRFNSKIKFENIKIKNVIKSVIFTEKEMKSMGHKLMKSIFDCYYPLIEKEGLER